MDVNQTQWHLKSPILSRVKHLYTLASHFNRISLYLSHIHYSTLKLFLHQLIRKLGSKHKVSLDTAPLKQIGLTTLLKGPIPEAWQCWGLNCQPMSIPAPLTIEPYLYTFSGMQLSNHHAITVQ